MSDAAPQINWLDDAGRPQHTRWRSLAGHPAPLRVVLADDSLSADAAFRLAQDGTGLLWLGDYQSARHLLQALGRRLDTGTARSAASARPPMSLTAIFLAQREARASRARILGQYFR